MFYFALIIITHTFDIIVIVSYVVYFTTYLLSSFKIRYMIFDLRFFALRIIATYPPQMTE